MTAAKKGDIAALNALLPRVSSNVIGADGKSALFYALSSQQMLATKLLVEHGADVNAVSHVTYFRDNQPVAYYEPPIITATKLGSARLLELLLNAGADANSQSRYISLHGKTYSFDSAALHHACEQSSVAMVQLLLDRGADVNVTNRQGEQPLHIVSRCKQCAAQQQILQLLCHQGANVNALNKTGRPPLYMAAFYGCETKVSDLITYGANVDYLCLPDNSYGTALHIAAIKDNYGIANALVRSGALLDIQNSLGYTALQLNINTRSRSQIAELLIVHGASTSTIDYFRFTLLASCLRTTRLDCESLAPLMVYAGYKLWPDDWLAINTSSLPGPSEKMHLEVELGKGRIRRLCDWLREMRHNTLPLKCLARIAIRQQLTQCTRQHTIPSSIRCLPLPPQLIDFLLLKELVLNSSLFHK